MDHSLWLWLLAPLSASGLRPGRPPWGVRPQGTTTLSNFFIKKHPIFILLTIMIKHRSLETRVRKNCKISIQGRIHSVNLKLEAQGPMGNPILRFQAFNQVLNDAIMNKKFKLIVRFSVRNCNSKIISTLKEWNSRYMFSNCFFYDVIDLLWLHFCCWWYCSS